MKTIGYLVAALALVALAVMPVHAFTLNELTITVAGNGDARVDMQYDLSFVEQTAVFFRIANPSDQLQSAFAANTAKPVTVTKATSSSAEILIPSFATVGSTDGKSVITTPAVSFERARDVLNAYWFARLVSPDFSPAVTTIVFPDGYQAHFTDQIRIPPVTHAIQG